MALVSLLIDLVAACLTITIGIVIYCKFAFKYWKKRNTPQLRKPKLLLGDLFYILRFKEHLGVFVKNDYCLGKSQEYKHVGYFACTLPIYIPYDVEYIKNILQRDFKYFTERGFYYNEKDDPISANLFAFGGEKWRILRTKLSPAFTSRQIKMVFDNLVKCTYQMHSAMEKNYELQQSADIKEVSECFTMDTIGSCAFGLECNSFKNPEAEFRKQGKKTFSFTPFRIMRVLFAFCYPDVARWLGIRLFEKDSNEFFINVVKNSLKYRKTNEIVQKNFLQLLLDLGNDPTEKNEAKTSFAVEELAAQVFVFFAAGFETSSTTLTFCLYELALNPNIQTKLRDEIHQVLRDHSGNMSYDAIMNMRYLNQVVKETLRKYPPVPYITRVAVNDYQMPDTETIIGKGVQVLIPIMGLHYDPDYYPDPEKFDPERFSEKDGQQRPPFTYMPFGEGPRICIGLRFGLMQVKVGLVALLEHYKFSLNNKTELPLQFEKFRFTLTPKSGIFLDIERV